MEEAVVRERDGLNEWEREMLDIAARGGVLAACREAAAQVYDEWERDRAALDDSEEPS